jgi:hypothetical protein
MARAVVESQARAEPEQEDECDDQQSAAAHVPSVTDSSLLKRVKTCWEFAEVR